MQAVSVEGVLASSEVAAQVHPAVLQLGLRYADGSIRGASARCVAMLVAFRTLVQVQAPLPAPPSPRCLVSAPAWAPPREPLGSLCMPLSAAQVCRDGAACVV